MIKSWINARMKERTSWDGAMLVGLGLMVLFLAPLAKIAAGAAIIYGGWTIWKKDQISSILILDPAGKFNNLRCSTPLR